MTTQDDQVADVRSGELASIVGAVEASSETAKGAEPVAPTDGSEAAPAADVVDLDIGDGVTRSVPLSELSDLFRSKSDIEKAKAAVRVEMEELADARALVAQIRSYDDDVKEQIADVLRNPEMLRRIQDGDYDLEDSSTSSGPANRQVAELARKVEQLQAYAQQQQHREQQTNLVSRVEEQLSTLKVFQPDPRASDEQRQATEGMREWAKEAILLHLQQNPNQSIDDLVNSTAVRTHRLLAGLNQPGPSPDPRGRFEAPAKPLTGRDLQNGGVRRTIESLLNR